MNLSKLKKLTTRLYGVGLKRVKLINVTKEENIIKRSNVKDLVAKGKIKLLALKGVTRHKTKAIPEISQKQKWMKQIRVLRFNLKVYKVDKTISPDLYKKTYYLIKSNTTVRTKAQLHQYIKNELKKKE